MKRIMDTSSPVIAKINVMPIIDVALVLVVVLLITAPMIQVREMDLTLPNAQTRGAEDELRVIITLGENGELAVDEELIGFDQLPMALERRLNDMKDDNVLVVLRADSGASYQVIRSILKEARNSGARRLAIATRQGEDKIS